MFSTVPCLFKDNAQIPTVTELENVLETCRNFRRLIDDRGRQQLPLGRTAVGISASDCSLAKCNTAGICNLEDRCASFLYFDDEEQFTACPPFRIDESRVQLPGKGT